MAISAAFPFFRRKRSPARLAGEIAIGAGTLVAGAFAAYFLRERSQEEPPYTIIEQDGAFSLRRYQPYLTASVRREGSVHAAMSAAFAPLADYIFAKPGGRKSGSTDEKIAMAVPVSATPVGDSHRWDVRFTLPRQWTRRTLPEPATGITIDEQPGRVIAAVQFAGRSTDGRLVARKRAALLAWLDARGMIALSEPEFAGYNAPIVPAPLRRNEWWVEVDWAEAVTPG